VRQVEAERWLESYMMDFWQEDIGVTTRKTIASTIQQAQREGWSVPTMQKNLTNLFKQWMTGDVSKEEMDWYGDRLPPHRTEMIARTETIRSSNAGSQALFEEWGIKKKNGTPRLMTAPVTSTESAAPLDRSR